MSSRLRASRPDWDRGGARRSRPRTGRATSATSAEIFAAFGMDLDTPGTRDTPRRFLRALFDATAGYDGDPKLRTAFPAERPEGVEGRHSQIVEGPISLLLRSASTTRCRSTASRTSATSPATRSSASRS